MKFPHTATYWAPAKPGRDGKATFESPIEIPCRWEDRQEEFISTAGNTETSTAIIYTLQYLLDQIPVENILTLGAMRLGQIDLADPFPNDPFKDKPGTWEIRFVGNDANMRATKDLVTIKVGSKRAYSPSSRA